MNLRDLPRTPLALIAAMFAAGAASYRFLGERIPMHWNAMGQIDRWEPKSYSAVFLLPLISLGLYALFAVLPYFDPKRKNLKLSKHAYGLVLTATVGLMTVIHGVTLVTAMGYRVPVDRVIVAAVGLMIAYIGNLMRTVKQNWTMGFRYSWTLADETVWARTNELGGRLFVGVGLFGLLGVLVPAPWNIVVLIVPLLATVPVTYGYAMVTYRRLHPDET